MRPQSLLPLLLCVTARPLCAQLRFSLYVPDDDGSTTPKQLVINTFNVVRVSP